MQSSDLVFAEKGERNMNLLGNEDTGAGRVKTLGVNAADLMARAVRSDGRKSISSGHGTHLAAVPSVIDGHLGRHRNGGVLAGLESGLQGRSLKDVAAGPIAKLERTRTTKNEISKWLFAMSMQSRLTQGRGPSCWSCWTHRWNRCSSCRTPRRQERSCP
jgi:hypothetical protein